MKHGKIGTDLRLNSRGGHEMKKLKFRTLYEGPYGIHPREIRKTGGWRSQRPVINVEKCCQCGWCYLYCPGGCMEDDGTYFVPNLDYCKGCGICAEECPVNAIKMIPEGGE